MDTEDRATVTRNQAILAFMKSPAIVPLKEIVVSYSGAGDSGDVEEVTPYFIDDTPEKISTCGTYLDQQAPEKLVEMFRAALILNEPRDPRPVTYADLVGDLWYSFVQQYQPGWEINEGSSGIFTLLFDHAAGTATWELNHNENVVEPYFHGKMIGDDTDAKDAAGAEA